MMGKPDTILIITMFLSGLNTFLIVILFMAFLSLLEDHPVERDHVDLCGGISDGKYIEGNGETIKWLEKNGLMWRYQ